MWIHWESSILHELKLDWDVSHTSKTEARDNQITLRTILLKIVPSVKNPLPQSSCLHILYRKPGNTHLFILVPTSIPSFSTQSSCIFHQVYNLYILFLVWLCFMQGLRGRRASQIIRIINFPPFLTFHVFP